MGILLLSWKHKEIPLPYRPGGHHEKDRS